MGTEKIKFWKISEIDATGVRGPHEKELDDISKAKNPLFKAIDKGKLEKIVVDGLGGKLENIGFNEDWTITVEMFPEVNIHMAYSYFGDEFGDGIEAEFKFYFSGERVFWIPGEDTATFIGIVMDFLERKIKEIEPFEQSYEKKTELMNKVLIQRSKPFQFLTEHDKENLAAFIGGKIWKSTTGWHIKKELFPEIFTELTWDESNGLDITFSGENLPKSISNYYIEFIGIFVVNHILRYITMNNLEKNLPDICYIMFSRYFTKLRNWDHRRI